MYISVSDLDFLIHLENKLGSQESWSEDVIHLWELVEKLSKQRDNGNEKVRAIMAERRKTDKSYGRSKS